MARGGTTIRTFQVLNLFCLTIWKPRLVASSRGFHRCDNGIGLNSPWGYVAIQGCPAAPLKPYGWFSRYHGFDLRRGKTLARIQWRFEFKRQDTWVGVFWDTRGDALGSFTDIWICVLPCVPLHIKYGWGI